MSSCFNGDWHARQLRWLIVSLALLAGGTAQAQTVDGEPFSSETVYGRTTLGGAPLRIWHQTRGYGKEASDTAIGGRGAFDLGTAVGFTDGQFRISNESRFGANLGGGVRWYGDDFLVGQPRIFGVSGWYDGQETVINNYFNQGGVSFESLGEYVDFRLNANIPFEDQKLGDDQFVTGGLNFSGNSLAQATITPADIALRVVDFEVAPRVMDLNLWMYGGGYQMDGNGVSETGAKVGFRGYLTNDLAVDLGVTDDEVFHTNTVFQLIWTPGRTGAGPTSWIHTLADRMREPVYRNTYIATEQRLVEGSMALTSTDGSALRMVHVNSAAAEGGDGSFERPFNELTDIQGATLQGDVILVHAGSTFTDETATLIAEQRLLGEGGGNTHTVSTSQLGTITIPETFAGALGAARPTVTNNTTTDIVNLTQSNADASAFTAMEVSNFTFSGGDNAIATSTGVGAVNINRLAISDTENHAIALTPITETLSGGNQRVRFSPTIDDVTLTDIGGAAGGDGILLTDVASLPGGTTSTGTIAISDVTSTNTNTVGAGAGIRLVNGRRTATINGYDWTGGSTGEGALSVENATAQGNVTVTGDNAWTGGAGYAINLDSSANAVTVTGTTITNTGGDTIVVDAGTANLSFTGRINQANNASVLSVSGGHATGTLTFTELTANAGVINATNGDGLQFDNADGTYTFNDAVLLVSGPGGNAGIDVTNGSSGTFAFTDTANVITEQSGDAIAIQDSNAVFTYEGTITTDNTSARPIYIEGNSGGSITIAAAINASDDGIVIENNTGGTILFSDQVTLNTAGNDAVAILNNTGGSTRFDNIDITTTSGRGFVATSATTGHTVTVAGNDNNITTTTGTALQLDTIAVGSSGINFDSVSSNGAVNAIIIEDVTGGAVNIGAGVAANMGGTINNSAGAAIQITNAANVNLNEMVVTGTAIGFNSVTVNHNTANSSIVSITNSEITGGLEGIDFNRGALATAASRITLTGNTVNGTAGDAVNMNISGSGSVNIVVTDNIQLDGGDDQAFALEVTGGASKDVRLLMDNNTLNNNSLQATAEFDMNGGGTLNATITDNMINNGNLATGRAFDMASTSGAVRLNLNDNEATTGNATPEYLLTETGGDFNVQGVATVDDRNVGDVEFQPNQGAFDDDAGTIPTP